MSLMKWFLALFTLNIIILLSGVGLTLWLDFGWWPVYATVFLLGFFDTVVVFHAVFMMLKRELKRGGHA